MEQTVEPVEPIFSSKWDPVCSSDVAVASSYVLKVINSQVVCSVRIARFPREMVSPGFLHFPHAYKHTDDSGV